MWYGLVGLPLKSENFNNYVPTRIALVMAKNLARYEIDGAPASELWERIYEPTVFFVGKSDDFSFNDYWPIIEEVFGSYPHVNKFGDNALIDEFLEQVKSLPGPGIEQYVPVTEEGGFVKGARQFRFMGQRFIPDSRIIQELVHNSVENRLVPSGLDVFSALGSDRAVEIMEEYYGTGNFPDYAPQMAAMREEVNNYDLARWQSNLYFGWIWSLNSIIAVPDEWQPSFMQNQAWLDKSLFTAMGSWTELRHDTILYGKQSGAECGGDYEEPPAQPRGYVEPNIDFWNKMLWLIRYTQNGLNDSGLADAVLNKQYEWMPDANLNDRFDWLAEIVEGCRTITIKELTGEQLTMEDYEFIEFYGSRLEGLYLTLAEGPILSEDDRDMAIVADVHNIGDTVLEEGIGHAAAIYVIVPVEGKLVITRGAVFTQYEFLHPAADRLTNEKWREWLQNGEEPPFAGWTESFMVYSDNFPTFEHVDSAC
jgi:hypothetical protein